jgi:hypothetical protein
MSVWKSGQEELLPTGKHCLALRRGTKIYTAVRAENLYEKRRNGLHRVQVRGAGWRLAREANHEHDSG